MYFYDSRVEKTYQNLYHSLFTLLQNKNINSISVTEICRGAKVNRATFYKHFKQIDELFFSYIDFVLSDLHSKYEEQLRARFSLLNIQTVLFIHVEQFETFYRILFSEDVPLKYMNHFQESIQLLAMKLVPSYVLEKFQKDLYFNILGGAVCSSIKYWLENKSTVSAELMNAQLHEFFTVK